MSYFLAFLGFAALIILHEGGHFAAAKAVGMRVERFSLFFGPMFLKRQRGETEYGVGLIPLGGYVKITGMSPNEEFESQEIEARAYYNQPVWKRIVVIAAGPAVNIVLAFLIFWVLSVTTIGHDVTKNGQPVVTDNVYAVIQGTPAVGVLQAGDRIVSVDGVSGTPDQLRAQIDKHRCAGKQVDGCRSATAATIVVSRDGRLHTYSVHPQYSAAAGGPLVGFEFAPEHVSSGAVYAIGQSATGLWRAASATLSAIGRIYQPQERKQLHSVVGAADLTQQYIATSATDGLEILALISLSLGVVNLFPFLPLDGGHIFWAIVEKIRGKRAPFVVMERAGFVGIALILALFLVGFSNDVSSIAHGTLTTR